MIQLLRKAFETGLQVTNAYEIAKVKIKNRHILESLSPPDLTKNASAPGKQAARHLEQNHDLARSVLNTISAAIIGPAGINIEFQPKYGKNHPKAGEIHTEFASEINYWFDKWSESPEISGEYSRAELETLLIRTLYRDGEFLTKDIMSRRFKYNHDIPYAIEALETDYLDATQDDPEKRIHQGIRFDTFWRPVTYYLLDDPNSYTYNAKSRAVSADFINHVKLTDRLRQPRGMTVFSSNWSRFNDIKDYEDSERIAAKIASKMVAYIKRDIGTEYSLPDGAERSFEIGSGTIWDELLPGETPHLLDPNRPNLNLEGFRNGQMRAACGGANVSFPSVTKNYEGSYSAARQAMVEQYSAYGQMGGHFARKFTMPISLMAAKAIVLSNKVKVPKEINPDTIYDRIFSLHAMPWIDPLKEAKAMQTLVDANLESPQEIIKKRGRNPQKVKDEIKAWKEGISDEEETPERDE